MTTPEPPTDPPCGKAAGSAGRTNSGAATPKGWQQKEAGLWPATFRRAPSWVPSVRAPTCGRGEAHITHTCGRTKQVKNRATALNQELNACQTSCLTQGAMRRAEGLGPTRPRSARVGPAGAVEFVKHVHGVNGTAPQRTSGADTAPQGTTGLKVIASRNRLICNV